MNTNILPHGGVTVNTDSFRYFTMFLRIEVHLSTVNSLPGI